jgi:hypothetical protein
VYHARPEEIDPATTATIQASARTELELTGEHQMLFDELIDCLSRGEAPADHPLSDWDTAMHPDIQELLTRLRAAAPGFSCSNRRDRLRQIFVHISQRRLKETVSRLKAEMNRAALDPDRRGEVTEILRTIQELTRVSPGS